MHTRRVGSMAIDPDESPSKNARSSQARPSTASPERPPRTVRNVRRRRSPSALTGTVSFPAGFTRREPPDGPVPRRDGDHGVSAGVSETPARHVAAMSPPPASFVCGRASPAKVSGRSRPILRRREISAKPRLDIGREYQSTTISYRAIQTRSRSPGRTARSLHSKSRLPNCSGAWRCSFVKSGRPPVVRGGGRRLR